MRFQYLAALCFAFLAGCASMPDAQVKRVDGREIEFATNTLPGPVVVFENGLGGRMEWWSKVIPAISKNAAYFAYNRPGYGYSAPVSTPRDGEHIVQELREILNSRGLAPPYVLVGHSLGGLYLQLFARKYPQEVGALVLVDSTHPKQLEGDGALENQTAWVRGALKVLVNGVAKEELALLSKTGDQVFGMPVNSAIPVFVLSASKDLQDNSVAAQFANEKRRDIARMYPGSKQIWVDSGHGIPLEKPEAVVDAIRSAFAVLNIKTKSP